ncbi:hypothetical protein V6N12_073252 [Hibiscus sabdariffa]|uniref:Uncharacterized protein n=1 Tax=Hibiscus sabdariffa TaxID=183260 RepID=A0ABR2B7L1_9ROSI
MNLDMRDNHSSAKLDASPGAKVVSNSAKTRSPLTDIVFEYDYLELKTDPEILQIVTLQKNGIEAAAVPRARTEPGYVQSSDKAMRCWDLKPLSCHKTNFINLSPHDPALLIHDALGHKSRS